MSQNRAAPHRMTRQVLNEILASVPTYCGRETLSTMNSIAYAAPPEVPVPHGPATLIDVLRDRAAELGDKLAFRFVRESNDDAVERTYFQMFERAAAIAAELQQRLEPGDRVVLVYPPGLEFVEAFFGCVLAGVIAVPVAAPARRRSTAGYESILAAAQPKLILSSSAYGTGADGAELFRGNATHHRPWLATDLVATERQRAWREPLVNADDTAFLQFTSGSTTTPRGVILSHANLLSNAELIHRAFGTSTDSRGVFWLPLYHDMGLIGGVIQPLYCGGTSTLLAAASFLQRPGLWLETITATRATISGAPDFAYDLCARKVTPAEREKLDLSSLEVAFSGAERIRATTIERFNEAFGPCGFRPEAWFPCYGLAEATLIVTGGPRGHRPTIIQVAKEELARHRVREVAADAANSLSLVSSGIGMDEQEVLVVSSETREICPDGRVGEIWVRGPSVALGYHEQRQRTTEVFRAFLAGSEDGPFLRTGDLGFFHDGQLYVTGRVKDLLIIRGRNYYPDDIETSVANAYPSLRHGCCVALSVDDGDVERLVIVQELDPRQRSLDADAAIQAIRRAVAAGHDLEVDSIVLTKAGGIPKTSSGKPRRSACRDLYLTGELPVVESWSVKAETPAAPSVASDVPVPTGPISATQIETWLIERIANRRNLPLSAVRVGTPFLEFGMGSLDAVELAADLEKWTGRKLSPTAIYNHPTISALAQWLSQPLVTHEETPSAEAALPNAAAPSLAEISQLSDDELAAMLQLEMDKLNPR